MFSLGGMSALSSASSAGSARNRIDRERRQKDTINFMKEVMDHITHLGNFSKPVDTSTVTFVCAKGDAYFPRSNLTPMDKLWPGCEVRRKTFLLCV